jgi:hypothetical protein
VSITWEYDAVAGPHLPARPRHRRFEELKLAARQPLSQCCDAVRIACAGTHDHRAIRRRRQNFPLHHRLDLVGAEHRERDDAASRRHLSRRRHGLAAACGEPLVFRWVDVGPDNTEPSSHQAPGQHLAHQPKPDHADSLLHCTILSQPRCQGDCHVSVNARHWQADHGNAIV